MRFVHPPVTLSSADFARLQRLMLTMIGSKTALAALLRRKLGASVPAPSSIVSADRAVSGRQVRFSVNRRTAEERVLTWEPYEEGDRKMLSLLSARGLALMGLTPGASIFYRTDGHETEFIRVESVSDAGGIAHLRPAPAFSSVRRHQSPLAVSRGLSDREEWGEQVNV